MYKKTRQRHLEQECAIKFAVKLGEFASLTYRKLQRAIWNHFFTSQDFFHFGGKFGKTLLRSFYPSYDFDLWFGWMLVEKQYNQKKASLGFLDWIDNVNISFIVQLSLASKGNVLVGKKYLLARFACRSSLDVTKSIIIISLILLPRVEETRQRKKLDPSPILSIVFIVDKSLTQKLTTFSFTYEGWV